MQPFSIKYDVSFGVFVNVHYQVKETSSILGSLDFFLIMHIFSASTIMIE